MHFEGMTITVSFGGVILSVPRLSVYKFGPNFCRVDNVLPLDGLQNNLVHVYNRNIQPKKLDKRNVVMLTLETERSR